MSMKRPAVVIHLRAEILLRQVEHVRTGLAGRKGTKLSETGIPATRVERDVGALPLDTVRKIS